MVVKREQWRDSHVAARYMVGTFLNSPDVLFYMNSQCLCEVHWNMRYVIMRERCSWSFRVQVIAVVEPSTWKATFREELENFTRVTYQL